MKIFKQIFLILSLLLFTNCGFKVLDPSKNNNFSVQAINTTGEKRIGYKIKNDILINSQDTSANNIKINVNAKKTKAIKEKNIKNEVTKYQISIVSQIEIIIVENNTENKFTKSVTGDYLVGNNYSTTINNEKKLVDSLTVNLTEKILDEINLKFNDL